MINTRVWRSRSHGNYWWARPTKASDALGSDTFPSEAHSMRRISLTAVESAMNEYVRSSPSRPEIHL